MVLLERLLLLVYRSHLLLLMLVNFQRHLGAGMAERFALMLIRGALRRRAWWSRLMVTAAAVLDDIWLLGRMLLYNELAGWQDGRAAAT